MKKIVFLSAMVLFLLSAFATDTPAYAPHVVHAGFHPVYGHGMHLRPVYRAHKPFHPAAGFSAGRAFAAPVSMGVPSVQISLPEFTNADVTMNEVAVIEMTEISVPDFVASDASIEALATYEMTMISLPGFFESDAAIIEAAVMEMMEISLPDFTEADAGIEAEFSRAS